MKSFRTAPSAVILSLATLAAIGPLAFAAPAAVEDIRDIRAPLPIPPWWHWPLAIASAVLAAAVIVLLWRWWQRRRNRQLTMLERARQVLERAEKLAQSGRSHEWAELVAETMRGALAVRIGASVLPLTTNELAKAAWAQTPTHGEREVTDDQFTQYLVEAPQLLKLLETCDLARFAQANLDVNALLAGTTSAKVLLERLCAPHPQPKPKPDSEAAPITLRTGIHPNTPSESLDEVSQ